MPCLCLLNAEIAGGQGPDSIFVGAVDLNSEPQASAANTLPTEPPPNLRYYFCCCSLIVPQLLLMLLYELEDANIHKLKMWFSVISWQLYSSHILTSMNQWEIQKNT